MKAYVYCCGESGRELMRIPHKLVENGPKSGAFDDYGSATIGRVEFLADAKDIRRFLNGYGAWDASELADDDANRMRAYWIACGDIQQDPSQFDVEEVTNV
jgi:hypothetical protein